MVSNTVGKSETEVRQAIVTYAALWLLYDGGTQYGQSGNEPFAGILNDKQAARVRRIAMVGKRTALRETVVFDHVWERRLWRDAGLPLSEFMRCLDMGYGNGLAYRR